jgi:rhodanese-related sulfurtransferase
MKGERHVGMTDADVAKVARGRPAMGYENAYDYEGGKQDWVEAGLPTESG